MPSMEAVCHLASRLLPRLGMTPRPPQYVTAWIVRGYQHCRRFDFGDVQAVWFLEAGQLRFYARDRRLLRAVWLEDLMRSDRAAA